MYKGMTLNNTMATASFKTLSPNTNEYNRGSQFNSGLPMIYNHSSELLSNREYGIYVLYVKN